jgi:hypothetical protein
MRRLPRHVSCETQDLTEPRLKVGSWLAPAPAACQPGKRSMPSRRHTTNRSDRPSPAARLPFIPPKVRKATNLCGIQMVPHKPTPYGGSRLLCLYFHQSQRLGRSGQSLALPALHLKGTHSRTVRTLFLQLLVNSVECVLYYIGYDRNDVRYVRTL